MVGFHNGFNTGGFMKKLATLLMISTLLLLTACNAVEGPKNENVKKELSLQQVIEQVGQDSFSKKGLNDQTHIAEQDGYLYVITPLEGYAKSLRLVISVLKDNEFVVKEKETNLRIKNASLKYQFSNDTLLIRTTKYRTVPLDTTYSIAINKKGEVSKQIIQKDVPRNEVKTTFIQGLNGSYFVTVEDEHYQILNASGEVIYDFDSSDTYLANEEDYELVFLDEEKGNIYLRQQAQKKDSKEKYYVFDLHTEEMVVENTFTQKHISENIHYAGGKKGFYMVDNQKLSFYSTAKESVQLVDETELDASIENGEDLYLTVDDQYVNIYRIDGSSIQKYSYTRVDE